MSNVETPRRQTALSVRLGRALAWLTFVLALAFPAALVVNDVIIVVLYAGKPGRFPWAALVYTALDYYAIPVVLASIVVGHIALALIGANNGGRPARVGLAVSYTLLAIAVATFLIVIPLVSSLITHT